MKQRNDYFDFLRGMAIIMVVGIHTVPHIAEYYSIGSLVTIFVRQLLNCAVPLFFAISGFFIAKKDLSSIGKSVSFWKHQIPRVYVPCLVFSLGWYALSLRHEGNLLNQLAALFACGMSVYYFIALIIQFYFITPLLSILNRAGMILSALISAMSIVWLTYMIQIEGKSFPLLLYAGSFWLWVVFFVMGVWISRHNRQYSLKWAWLLITVGIIGSMAESLAYLPFHGGGLGIKLSSFVYSAGMIMLLLSRKCELLYRKNALTNIVLQLGVISFAVYLAHMYVRMILSRLLTTDLWIIHWVLTLCMTAMAIFLVKKVMPQNLAVKYFGIR